MHEILIEESVIGWKEFELEVMRDVADNFVVICSIENIDPMGVHTGDSITVAPILTLTRQGIPADARRGAAHHPPVGVETGGSNIQFAVNPANGRMIVIEMNPRVSRSSALASKATGFPIAKIAAKLALGYHLDEIPNDITRLTPASFEPTIDYVVVKIPRWNFEKFPQADRTLTTQMKSVGEAMAIGRTFKEAFMKGVRSLELGQQRPAVRRPPTTRRGRRRRGAAQAAGGAERSADVGDRSARSTAAGRVEQLHELTKIDPWFLQQFAEIVEHAADGRGAAGSRELDADELRTLKRAGFGDAEHRAGASDATEAAVRERRLERRASSRSTSASTPARPSSSRSRRTCTARTSRRAKSNPNADEQGRHPRQRPEPHRPGHRVRLLLLSRRLRAARGGLRDGDDQLQPGDGVDRLRHRRPAVLRAADVRRRDGGDRDASASAGGDVSCLVQFGGQTPLKLALALQDAGVTILGTSPDSIDLAEDRKRFAALLRELGHPAAGERHRDVARGSARGRRRDRLPGRGAAVVRARRPRHGDRLRRRRRSIAT